MHLISHKKIVFVSRATLICAWAEKGADAMGPDGTVVHSDAFPPEKLVDTLGAGDTFNASVIYTLSNGEEHFVDGDVCITQSAVGVLSDFMFLFVTDVNQVRFVFLQGAACRPRSHLAARLRAKNVAFTDMMESQSEHGEVHSWNVTQTWSML